MDMHFDKVDVATCGLGVAGFLFAAYLCKQAVEADYMLKAIGYGLGAAWFSEFPITAVSFEAFLLWEKKKLLEETKNRSMEEPSVKL